MCVPTFKLKTILDLQLSAVINIFCKGSVKAISKLRRLVQKKLKLWNVILYNKKIYNKIIPQQKRMLMFYYYRCTEDLKFSFNFHSWLKQNQCTFF